MVARYWGPVFFLKHLNKNGGKNGGTVSVLLHYLYRNGGKNCGTVFGDRCCGFYRIWYIYLVVRPNLDNSFSFKDQI